VDAGRRQLQRDRDELRDLTELADELLMQAGEIRNQWEDLAAAVGLSSPVPGEGAAPPPDDPMRLVALDMALSGSAPEEVAAHLEKTFPGADVDLVVDAVFQEIWRQ